MKRVSCCLGLVSDCWSAKFQAWSCAVNLHATPLVFTVTCDCKIGNRDALGFFWASVQHDPLPPPLLSSAIAGGKWNLTTLRGRFSGKVVKGTIVNHADDVW
jgi:hypothetical protein